MTTNRHPLQVLGAGQAQRQLPNEAVVPFCHQLSERLGWLGKVIGEEAREGRLGNVAAQGTQEFLQALSATTMVMALKHGRQLLDVEPVPLTIDPTESGMPTVKDFWTLRDDYEHAADLLSKLPSRDELLSQALDSIYSGQPPARQQILWLQRAYLTRLATTQVIADFTLHDPVNVGTDGDDTRYSLRWSGLVRSVNLFETTILEVIARSGWRAGGGVAELQKTLQLLADGRHALPEILGLCGEVPWVVPNTIERVTIGPYYHRWTENDSFVQQALAAAPDDEGWMLRCRIERAATTQPAPRSAMDKLFGREPMEAGPVERSALLLVPLSIKQHLGDADEEGNLCIVYGLSSTGDLVC